MLIFHRFLYVYQRVPSSVTVYYASRIIQASKMFHFPIVSDSSSRSFPGGKVHKTTWVCLKMLCTPKKPMVLLIIIPMKNGYFIGNIPNIFRQTHIMFNVVPSHRLSNTPHLQFLLFLPQSRSLAKFSTKFCETME